MTDRIVHLTPSLLDLGDFIQKHVQDGYTLMEGYPRQHGFQYEVIVDKAAQDTEESSTEDKPKRGRKAAVSEDK
jgi:hypothetical protein